MDKQIEYKKLYENLSIKWYYIEELNEKLIQETIHLLELYLKEIVQERALKECFFYLDQDEKR